MDTAKVDRVLETALSAASADQAEVVAVLQSTGTTRFSNSSIHQNMAEKTAFVSVRVVRDGRLGWASNHSFSRDAVLATVKLAEDTTRHQKPDPDFKSLPAPDDAVAPPFEAPVSEATINCPPRARATMVGKILEIAKRDGLSAAGTVETGGGVVGVANSLGIKAVSPISEASALALLTGDGGTGYASRVASTVDAVETGAIAERAAAKARRAHDPEDLPPGEYPVILEPEAVAEMVGWLGLAGLGALSVQEGRSFMCNRFGDRVVGENISIRDDAADPRTVSVPFDFEGVPKQTVALIDEGVARAVVYDSYTAGREGKKSTGHALPAPNTYGPLPLNLVMDGGEVSLEEMIKETSSGILVTRFHYTNLENPTQTVITGMTRDGTFLIEDGRVVKALKNLRFTQNILEALGDVQVIGSDLETKEVLGGGTYVVPSLKLGRFNFTGLSPS